MDIKRCTTWMLLILLTVTLFFIQGCAALSDNVITTGIDEAGNAVETVASANTHKTTSLYDAHVDIAKQTAIVNTDVGWKIDMYGISSTKMGDKEVFFAQFRISNRPVINIINKLPERIPDHWGKDVLISLFKYGTIAFGIDTAGNVVSSLLAGAAGGIAIEGSNNVIQGNQNKAGNDQDIRTDYVSCASGECGETDSDDYYNDGKCYVNPSFTCSCESYEAGLCTP